METMNLEGYCIDTGIAYAKMPLVSIPHFNHHLEQVLDGEDPLFSSAGRRTDTKDKATMSFAAAHRVFLTPELLLIILEHLENDHRSLRAAILVNKSFAEQGSAVLWRKFPPVSALAKLDEGRRQVYAAKIWPLDFMGDDGPHHLAFTGLKFPQLKDISVDSFHASDPGLKYIQPSLEVFSLFGGDVPLSFLDDLSLQCPRLRSLILDQPFDKSDSGKILRFFDATPQLTAIDFGPRSCTAINLEILSCFAGRKNLKILNLSTIMISEQDSAWILARNPQPFKGLVSIDIGMNIQVLANLLPAAMAESLQSLTVQIEAAADPDSRPDTTHALSITDEHFIRLISSLTTLVHLEFELQNTLSVDCINALAKHHPELRTCSMLGSYALRHLGRGVVSQEQDHLPIFPHLRELRLSSADIDDPYDQEWTIYVHTSGAKVFDDGAKGMWKSERIYRDDRRREDMDSVADDAPHREVDLALVAAQEGDDDAELRDHLRLAVMLPPEVYGYDARHDRLSIMIPNMTRFAIRHGYAPVIGEGLAVETPVHVMDLARGYVAVMHYLEAAEQADVRANPYWLCENGAEFSWREAAEVIARGLAGAGKVESAAAVGNPPPELYGELIGDRTESFMGLNCRGRAVRLRQLGWEPREKGIWESYLEDELPVILRRASESESK
ncbi:hypothetical protein DV735_g1409, partial [Chaetothyriales sp. CBS 134920]